MENLSDTSIFQIFTPTMPAQLNFIERDSVNDHLVDALRTPGRQIVLYGETGSGKSTLIQKLLERLYPGQITTRCTAASTYRELLLDAFDQANHFFIDEVSNSQKKSHKGLGGFDLKFLKGGVEGQREIEQGQTAKRIVSPELSAQRLGELLGSAGLCWIIEDLHKTTADVKRSIAQTLKVVSDLSQIYPTVRVIAIGAVFSARDVIQADREMRNRVAEISVPLMSRQEIKLLLENGARLANIAYADGVLDRLTTLSNGVPSTAHHLALNCCLAAGVETHGDESVTIESHHYDAGVRRYLDESSDTLRSLLESALKVDADLPSQFDGPRIVLTTLAQASLEGLRESEMFERIRIIHSTFPRSTLTKTLKALAEGNDQPPIRLTPDGKYRFSDPAFLSFVQGSLNVWTDASKPLSLAAIVSILKANWTRTNQVLEFTDADGLTYRLELDSGS